MQIKAEAIGTEAGGFDACLEMLWNPRTMPIKTHRILFWILASLTVTSSSSLRAGSDEPSATAIAAAMLIHGTAEPTVDAEQTRFAWVLQRESEALHQSPTLQQSAIRRAYRDTFGIDPKDPRGPAGSSNEAVLSYHEQVKHHLHWLESHTEAYEAVLQRAYQTVIFREAYEEEIAYWMQRDRQSYLILVACVEDWARRNQPGLMVTSGIATASVNCEFLNTLQLSAELASQVRAAMDLSPSTTVLAHGASAIASGGNIPFLLVADPDLHP